MKKLPERIRHKKKMFRIFQENLSEINEIEFFDTDLNNVIPWFNDILLPNEKIRNDLIDYLNNKGIGSRMFYPPIHKLVPYSHIIGKFQIADEVSSRGLWLPSSSFLTDDDILRVCNEIKNFLNS